MNIAHLHLILNHLPITFVILGFIVMVLGFLFKSEMVKRIAYLVFIFGALFGYAAFYTGEKSKQLIEGIIGIDERLIMTHEEIALVFLTFLYMLGILSLIGLIASWRTKPYSKIIDFVTIIFLIIVIYFAVQTGATGVEIRHSEIFESLVN
tara:strand:- start:927 stop:1379 length:453 start_codon:yes stop_codon:yes gene_type:complete